MSVVGRFRPETVTGIEVDIRLCFSFPQALNLANANFVRSADDDMILPPGPPADDDDEVDDGKGERVWQEC